MSLKRLLKQPKQIGGTFFLGFYLFSVGLSQLAAINDDSFLSINYDNEKSHFKFSFS